jgi:FAD/FMN-containing dehydrogenase
MVIMSSICRDLEKLVDCQVTNTPEILTDVSQDFGGVVQKYPKVVVLPKSIKDIVQTIKYASQKGIRISPRGAGHSLSGQSLNQNGIILNLKNLDRIREINKRELWFKADAGVSWGKVVNACLPQGVIPPVLTNYFGVSIGGTHASGGIGAASFARGSQADNCLGVEVVTAEGEVTWCSPEKNSELFEHVLCGYGQFGIITQIQHKLIVYRPVTRTYLLFYDDLNALLFDKSILVSKQRVEHLVSFPIPSMPGFSRSGGKLKPIFKWFYTLQMTVERQCEEEFDDRYILSGLNFYHHIQTEDLSFENFVQPIVEVDPNPDIAHPWMDVFLPASAAKKYIETVLEQLPSFLDVSKTQMGCFCLANHRHKMPLFNLPSEELIIGFGIYPNIPQTQLQPALVKLKEFSDMALSLGGKRYLTGWIEFDAQQWQIQLGDRWSQLNQMKQKYDPQGVFSSGFFQ